jgi:SSS family solute:Na+ symporter
LSSTKSNPLALAIIALYMATTIAVGYLVRRRSKSASQYLHARRALPTIITAIAFLAANCGALEIVGIVAATARYGALSLHFYWIGAIPAMVFLALFMMPIYVRSGAMTVPDLLRLRYNNATHILSSLSLAVMMAFLSGISLYAISSVLHMFFGWNFFAVVVAGAAVVFCYTLLGGLRATIYNEVLQLGLTIAGLVPLAYMVHRDFHGFRGALQQLPPEMSHLWVTLPVVGPKVAAMDDFGIVFGLGFVLASAYWCTDFVLIQRALAAKTIEGSIQTPLLAAVAKIVFPFFIILPGLAAAIFVRKGAAIRYDQALPLLMQHYYGRGLLGLGISAILASLMTGLAGNISAFSALCTQDFYKAHVRTQASDKHYLLVGRIFTATASCLSVATAYVAFRYNNLMDYLQLLFSLFTAPLFATFLLGMFTTWATPTAGFWGLLCGMLAAAAHNLAVRDGMIVYGSQMLANFYGAIYGWSVCLVVTIIVSTFTRAKPRSELSGITSSTQIGERHHISARSWILAGLVLAACVWLNYSYR